MYGCYTYEKRLETGAFSRSFWDVMRFGLTQRQTNHGLDIHGKHPNISDAP